jgi:hypothetical protein
VVQAHQSTRQALRGFRCGTREAVQAFRNSTAWPELLGPSGCWPDAVRPKLLKRELQWHDAKALTMAPSVGAYKAAILAPEEVRNTLKSVAPESLAARIASLEISPMARLVDALPAVKRTASRFKHPRRAELKFERGECAGAVFDLAVTPETLDRALALADTRLYVGLDV